MWIRNQDKNSIIDVVSFVAKKSASKKQKGHIYGYSSGGSSMAADVVIIGKYSTYDDALKEISNIENAIIENPSGVYQIL